MFGRPKQAERLQDDEPLARFLKHHRDFKPQAGLVRPRTFTPPANLRLSTFRISGLTEPAIWDVALHFAGTPALARAVVAVGGVRETGLEVDPDDSPPRHATIQGWPAEKARQMHISQVLAARAVLVIKPDMPPPDIEPGGA